MARMSESSLSEMDPSQVRLIGAWVMVRRDRGAEKSHGLFVPDDFRKVPNTGVLAGVGPLAGKTNSAIRTGAGVVVHASAFHQARFKWGDDVYDVLNAEDIEAVMEAGAS